MSQCIVGKKQNKENGINSMSDWLLFQLPPDF